MDGPPAAARLPESARASVLRDQWPQRNRYELKAYVGRPDMLRQSEHRRGSPYLYQTDAYMFLLITDDEAWAEDALQQMP